MLFSITALLIILPLIFAIINIAHHEQLQKRNLLSVTLYDNNSIELASEAGVPDNAEEDSLIRIFYELITAPRSPVETPELFSKNVFIKASIILNDKTNELICYFSPDSDEGIYKDSANNFFFIPKEVNEAFLLLPYSEIFYDAARSHDLVSADKDTIIPTSVNWYYKDVSNTFIRSTKNESTNVQKTYDITSTVNLNFEKPCSF